MDIYGRAIAQINVSIPDRVLGFFRRFCNDTCIRTTCVSIPDRVLGFFRLNEFRLNLALIFVSIPDRVLGFFRHWSRKADRSPLSSFNP